MKILVLSDSHAALSFMRLCIEKVKPAHVIHLGDHFDDGKVMAEQYGYIIFHQVPGNCDRFRCDPWQADILCYDIAGVRMYMTHGHKHRVKQYLLELLRDARASRVDAVLFGHTHEALCIQEPDGLWVLNPGSCGYHGGSSGLIEVDNGKIKTCRILRQDDLEALR